TKDKLIAARDRCGFRPLCMGRLGDATVFASESCALDCLGATFERDIKPGEVISVDLQGNRTVLSDEWSHKMGLCVFELIYIARPDSVIDGMSVYRARLEMGKALYRQKPTKADIVCGVPDSGLDAALGYSLASGIRYASAFVKNRYTGRSFILPNQADRERTVNVKLNPLKEEVAGKSIVLVDDSIVRGTTSARIIKSLRKAGAKEIHLRISSPPFKHPCYFGTDIDSEENLIANKMDVEEIRKSIGADSLEYLSLENLLAIKHDGIDYCTGCFSGQYPIPVKGSGKDKFDD
ncbi:MAG: amidophosphoribosyltransferase, partial [Clostridiales bacterium]|nr:amidophosphoribosyltransferase [Clostridiales bacterium]